MTGDEEFLRNMAREFEEGFNSGIELRYLEICERAPDGTWRVMWGMDGPVQETVPRGLLG